MLVDSNQQTPPRQKFRGLNDGGYILKEEKTMTHHTGHDMSNRTGLANSDINDTTGSQSILSLVHEGMDVYDVKDDRIGSVDFVHFGAASETQQELGTGPASPAPADNVQMREDTIIDNIAEAFVPNEIPQPLQEKLLLSGFIRLDTAGLFAADRYITPDQISGVVDDKVQLSVTRDQLIKRR
jgi:hypothetical protein